MTSGPDYTVVHPMPGLGKPLDYVPKEDEDPLYIDDPFPSALDVENLDRALLPLTTLREFSLLQLMNAITDKENWHVKIFDDAIASKWKAEAIEAAQAAFRAQYAREFRRPPTNLDTWPILTAPRDESSMTPAMADFCIAELRHKARSFQNSPNGAIVVYNGDVVKSDSAVSPEVKSALQKAVEPLENVPAHQKDWHPGSREQVLDLVHPSLFPLVYGLSKVLPVGAKATNLDAHDAIERSGEGDIIPIPEAPPPPKKLYSYQEMGPSNTYSTKFQWMPCEVDISGNRAKILSYINNLHPEKHGDLYRVIEDVITAAIPLWDLTLGPLAAASFQFPQRIVYTGVEYDPEPEDIPTDQSGLPGDVDDDNYWDLRNEWIRRFRRVILPDVEKPFDAEEFDKPVSFSLKNLVKDGRPLQVIVKLANIELTPENPRYRGGTWHVEGQLNERIVATALYYYSSANITSSSLAFRQLSQVRDPDDIYYPQNVHDWLDDIYGCRNEHSSAQDVGSVVTHEGRLLTFPNILQHRVQPFSLDDKTKPGHRKILALFLVDPHVRVVSTAHVPAQRIDWWREDLEISDEKDGNQAGLARLPVEIRDYVYDQVDEFPISLVEAKKLREELMEERKRFVLNHENALDNVISFSLCEH
ncbi:hypothetical protein CC2G_004221 [Coprinopsis cinerea AmutBmut pab1-1]|nr:hypothetical protein CC2G_004221 [Coprinopsis cinerea AmutBmut pab1-1]